MNTEKKINGWYDGENIKSTIKYYSPKKEINEKIEFMQFMGHSGIYKDMPIQMSFYIRFKDGTDKWFLCEQNEDGSFDKDIFEETLKKADDYFNSVFQENQNKS